MSRSAAAPARRTPVYDRIMEAAVDLFAEKGFDATSVAEIVERAAVTKGALYHYFASKDDLLFEIYHRLIGAQLSDLDRITSLGLPPDETLRALIADLIASTTGNLREAAVFGRESHKLDAAHSSAVRADRRRYHDAVRTLVERAQQDGTFARTAPAETVTLIIFGMINQMPKWYRPDGPKAPAELATELADFVLAGLRP
ncbi:MAG: TetR family transcriptional regulator [Streptosporangiales bacterium]|nr:TetR family transcriptional regulator [Streptosporangiales bacterium]